MQELKKRDAIIQEAVALICNLEIRVQTLLSKNLEIESITATNSNSDFALQSFSQVNNKFNRKSLVQLVE